MPPPQNDKNELNIPNNEWEAEILEMLNDPIRGLKPSSNTNKTRYGILGRIEQAIEAAVLADRVQTREKADRLARSEERELIRRRIGKIDRKNLNPYNAAHNPTLHPCPCCAYDEAIKDVLKLLPPNPTQKDE